MSGWGKNIYERKLIKYPRNPRGIGPKQDNISKRDAVRAVIENHKRKDSQ